MRAKMPSPERSPWPGVRRHPDDHFSTLGQAPERGRGTPLGYGLIIRSALPTQQTSELLCAPRTLMDELDKKGRTALPAQRSVCLLVLAARE